MQIAGIQRTSLIDYPGKVSATLFTLGCNMKCPYCHNKQISFDFADASVMDLKDVFDFFSDKPYSIFKLLQKNLKSCPQYDKSLENFQYSNYVAILKNK